MRELHEIEEKVKEIIKKQLGKEVELSEINSIQFIKLVVIIEEEFNMEFDDNALSVSNFENIEELAEYVIRKIV